MSIETRIASWLEGPFDPQTKAEIRRLQKENRQALTDAFFKDLSFGTGGMRGIMGVGTNRINVYTIRMATQGLANYIKMQSKKNHKVFIGYDVRHNSRLFAEETAKVLAGNGIEAIFSKEICPTPLVSFACRHLHCSAAVMITASHNPPQYNGYKVYWNDGCQVVPPHDVGIMEEVKKIKNLDQICLGNRYEESGNEIDIAYLQELKKLQMLPMLAKTPLKIVYSNLHGTGIRLVPKALKEWGYADVSLVEKQMTLDGNFPNAMSPNPEEEKALALGSEQLLKEHGDILIATDPDADRIGVVVRNKEKTLRITGNQFACLALYHICTTLRSKNQLPSNAAFIKTIVTTELFRAIAESFQATCFDVLTGFKYIGEQITLWEKENNGKHFIFGAEESYGCLFGTFVRDKDAVIASCLIAEVAAAAKKEGLNLADRLNALYAKYGVYREALVSLNFPDSKEGIEKMQNIMKGLRENPPLAIAGLSVVSVEDFLPGTQLPPSDVLRYWLKDQSKIVIRPSGTEPKIKIYIEVKEAPDKDVDGAIARCDGKLRELEEHFKKQI